MKPVRSFLNDSIYRISVVMSSPSRFAPQVTSSFTDLLYLKRENKRLQEELEKL